MMMADIFLGYMMFLFTICVGCMVYGIFKMANGG